MADLTVKESDFGFYLNFTVLNDDGTPFVLTGYTITIKVWPESSRPAPLFTGDCPIVVAGDGTCRYLLIAADLSASGAYKLELELTKVGVELSTRSYDLNIIGSP
jgi:hypothetical protein